jgi:hypothetical protein
MLYFWYFWTRNIPGNVTEEFPCFSVYTQINHIVMGELFVHFCTGICIISGIFGQETSVGTFLRSFRGVLYWFWFLKRFQAGHGGRARVSCDRV